MAYQAQNIDCRSAGDLHGEWQVRHIPEDRENNLGCSVNISSDLLSIASLAARLDECPLVTHFRVLQKHNFCIVSVPPGISIAKVMAFVNVDSSSLTVG